MSMSTPGTSVGVVPVGDALMPMQEREWTFMSLAASGVQCVRCHRLCGPAGSPAWSHPGPPAGVVCDECADALGARAVWGDVDKFGLDG
jgi:hypothetical protein